MAKKTEKTNAARLLDKAGIQYRLIPYEFDENDLATQHVADSLGQDIARVFKTLVMHGDKTGHIVCVVIDSASLIVLMPYILMRVRLPRKKCARHWNMLPSITAE